MYPLAKLLRGRGYKISGSDRNAREKSYIDDCGIRITRGDGTMGGAGLVVYSLAIDESDPEILTAKALGIPLISRAQLLGALMRECPIGVSVSGSHGKSTVTAMLDRILSVSATAHTTVCGATLAHGEAYTDGGGIFVAEACEYKDSFLRLSPTHQLITAVELDHTDYFPTLEDIRASFLKAAKKAPHTFINIDDTVAREIATDKEIKARADGEIITYGYSDGADYRICDVNRNGKYTTFKIAAKDRAFNLKTSLIGAFNLYNIAAAVTVADRLGIAASHIESAIEGFLPIERRLSLICTVNGAPVYYDYAHHPSEIGAVIDALRERYGSLTVIFRPHTYSRTQSLWREFISALSKADFTILLDIYPAREKSIEGVDSKILANLIKNCTYATMRDAALLATSYRVGAIALLGAGEVDEVKRDLVGFGKEN